MDDYGTDGDYSAPTSGSSTGQSATDWLFGKGDDVLSGVIGYFKKAGDASLQQRVNDSQAKQYQMYRSTEMQYQNLGGTMPVGGRGVQPAAPGGLPAWAWAAGAVGVGVLVLLLVKK